jgi:hypothetical protein
MGFLEMTEWELSFVVRARFVLYPDTGAEAEMTRRKISLNPSLRKREV